MYGGKSLGNAGQDCRTRLPLYEYSITKFSTQPSTRLTRVVARAHAPVAEPEPEPVMEPVDQAPVVQPEPEPATTPMRYGTHAHASGVATDRSWVCKSGARPGGRHSGCSGQRRAQATPVRRWARSPARARPSTRSTPAVGGGIPLWLDAVAVNGMTLILES